MLISKLFYIALWIINSSIALGKSLIFWAFDNLPGLLPYMMACGSSSFEGRPYDNVSPPLGSTSFNEWWEGINVSPPHKKPFQVVLFQARLTTDQSSPIGAPVMHDLQSQQWWCNSPQSANTPLIVVQQACYSLLRWSAYSSLWPFTIGSIHSIHSVPPHAFALCPRLLHSRLL